MDVSFLNGRRQRVKINNTFSDLITLKGGMPQGTWLGPLTFIIFLDDLNPPCAVHKLTWMTQLLLKSCLPDKHILLWMTMCIIWLTGPEAYMLIIKLHQN